MKVKNFIAKYSQNGFEKVVSFDSSRFDKAKAEKLLSANGIQDFFFFFEPVDFVDMPDGSVMVSGEVGFDITLERLMPYISEGREIVIDSGGGSLFEGYRIYDYIKAYAPDTKVSVLGMAASAATLPLAASKFRRSTENSRFLIHNPWTFAVGDADTMRIESESLQKEEDNLVNIYANLFGKTTDEIKALMKPERFLTAAEAMDLNLITEIKGGSVAPLQVDKQKKEESEMTEEQVKGFMDKISDGFAKVMNLIKPKNIVLQDVNGVELDFGPDVISEEQVVVGITGVTANGEQANDTYTFASGKVVVIEAGTVTTVTMPEEEIDAAVEQLQAENALLKQEIVNLKAENSTLAKANAEVNAAATKAFNDFTAFKNQFSKGGAGSAAVPPVVKPAENVSRKAWK